MSDMRESERDINLKLRTMRYLWNLGYYVRKNVAIMELQESRKQYTDIDVLAVKLDEEFNSNFMICDCKSGVQAKTRERLFWLSGVMKFFGATQGMFVRTRLFSGKYMELTKRLGIMPLSEEQLAALENSYGIDNNRFFGPFATEHTEADKIFSILRQFSPEISDYLRSLYWEDTPAQQIATLVACCKRIKQMKEIQDNAKDFLLMYSLSSLALSVLRFAKNVLVIPNNARDEFIRIELLGGVLEHEERKKLLRGFYDFMVKEIQERYRARYPITSSQFLESLIPSYSKYLADIVMRLCKNPRHYIFLPRLFDLIAYEGIVAQRNIQIQDILEPAAYVDTEAIVKPMKDFVVFAERSELLTRRLSKFLNEKINSIT